MSKRKQKLTVDQLCENVGWAAKWEARGKAEGRAEGGAEKAFSIAQNMVNLGLPRRTRLSKASLLLSGTVNFPSAGTTLMIFVNAS